MSNPVVSALQTFQANQYAGEVIPYPIDASALVVNAWVPNAWMPASGLIRPTGPNQTGFAYQASAQGQTGELEPAWPTTAGGTVVDGSLTWTAVVPHNVGEDSISSVVWSQKNPPDATLTIGAQSNTQQTFTASIGGGTSGNTYTVLAMVTFASGQVRAVLIIVSIL